MIKLFIIIFYSGKLLPLCCKARWSNSPSIVPSAHCFVTAVSRHLNVEVLNYILLDNRHPCFGALALSHCFFVDVRPWKEPIVAGDVRCCLCCPDTIYNVSYVFVLCYFNSSTSLCILVDSLFNLSRGLWP